MSDTGGEFEFEATIEANEAQIASEVHRMAVLIENSFGTTFAKLGREFGREFFKNFGSATKANTGGKLLGGLDEGLTRTRTAAVKQINAMREDFVALQETAEATSNTLARIGSDPKLASGLNRTLAVMSSNLRELDAQLERGDINSERFAQGLAKVEGEARRGFRQLGVLQSVLKAETETRAKAANQAFLIEQQRGQKELIELRHSNAARFAEIQKANAKELIEDRVIANEIIQNDKKIAAQRVAASRGRQDRLGVDARRQARLAIQDNDAANKAIARAQTQANAQARQQQRQADSLARVDHNHALRLQTKAVDEATKQRLAVQRAADTKAAIEQRAAANISVAQERATAQRRTEAIRFFYRQVQAFERGLAGVFRGTARVLGGALGGVSAVTSRLAGIFRRSNRDMNDGLRGALLQREKTISGSFNRQSISIRQSLRQQSIAIERFEAQASTGVVGALTGRSRVGTALGLGAGIGGGFALFQGLRNGFQVGGDFVQGLAVLQAQLELTDEQMQAVRAQSIELGNDISLPGVSALDAAQAIQILAKQFANLGEAALPAAQGAARGVLQLARAAGVGAEDAARVVGAAVNVFGLNANQAVIAADQVTNALTKAAGVGFNDFSDAFTQSAGVVNLFTGEASNAGQAMAEFNAAIAILAKNGLIGSDAGTSLKQFFLQANRGTADAKEKLEDITAAAHETGSVFFDAAGNARTLSESLDILRRGTKDLNAQQFSATLGKLFGSDAARAAAFLIRSTKEEFDGLVTSIRRAGSAADIAAAQNTGLRGALDALQSVIETQQIKTYEKYQGVLAEVVLRFADLLNAFFEGRGRMGLLKKAIEGVAVALGALLVAKAVGEAFQFMAIGLRAVLSPLGVLVTGLAALGAAVAVLREVSPEFREETDKIGASLKDRFSGGLGLVGDLLAKVSRFLRTEIIPRFVDFSVALVRRVLPVVGAVAGELSDMFAAVRAGASGEGVTSNGFTGFLERIGVGLRQVVIAAQAFTAALGGREFTKVLTESGVLNEERQTRFVRFAERLGQAVGGLRAALSGEGVTSTGLVGFAERVGVAMRQAAIGVEAFTAAFRGNEFTTVLSSTGAVIEERQTAFVKFAEALGGAARDAVDAISGIASAISTALDTGDFSPVRDRIVAAFGGLVDRIIDVLGPQLLKVQGFIADQFSAKNLERVVTNFAQTAFKIGETLGLIVSDPKFIQALEAVVAAIAATAGIAIAGFAKGISENLPELGHLLVRQIQFVFNEIFTDGINYKKLGGFFAAGLAGALLLAATFSGFRTALSKPADRAGKEAAKSFGKSFTTNARSLFNSNEFVRGFTGGLDRVVRDAERKGAQAGEALLRESARAARQLQVLNVPLNIDRFVQTPQGPILEEGQFRNAAEQLRFLKTELGEIPLAGATVRASLSGVVAGVRDVASGVREVVDGIRFDFADKGAQTIRGGFGKIKDSVATGLGAIRENLKAASVGLGQALGGAILSGVGAALSGQQLGTATGTGGRLLGLSGIIASSLFAASAFGGATPTGIAVGGFVAALGLVSAAIAKTGKEADDAKARIQDYLSILRDTKTAEDRQKQLQEAVEGVLEAADPKSLRLLAQSGFDIGKFADDALEGAFNSQTAFEQIARGLGITTNAIVQFRTEASKAGTSDIAGLISDLKGDPGKEFRKSLEKTGVDVDAFIELIKLLGGEQDSIFAAAERFGSLEIIDANATTAVERATAAVHKLGPDLDELAKKRFIRLEIPDLEAQQRGLDHVKGTTDAVNQAISELDRIRTENLTNRISEVNAQLQAARDSASQALENIKTLFGPDLADPILNAFDQLVSALPSAQEDLKKAIAENPNIDLFALTPEASHLRQAFAPVLGPLQELVTGAITGGLADFDLSGSVDKDEIDRFFRETIRPTIDSITVPVETQLVDENGNPTGEVKVDQVGLDPGVKDFIFNQMEEFVNNPALVAELQHFEISNEAAQRLQDDLDDLNASLKVDIEFDPRAILAKLVTLQHFGLFTGDLPSLGEIVTVQQIARQTAQQAAIDARLPANTSALPPLAGGGVFIDGDIVINGQTQPLATAGEVLRTFRSFAASGQVSGTPRVGALRTLSSLAS